MTKDELTELVCMVEGVSKVKFRQDIPSLILYITVYTDSPIGRHEVVAEVKRKLSMIRPVGVTIKVKSEEKDAEWM